MDSYIQASGGQGWGPSIDYTFEIRQCSDCGTICLSKDDGWSLSPHRAVLVASSCMGQHAAETARHAATAANVGELTTDQDKVVNLDNIDGERMTSSRAEIYAVIHGLEQLKNYIERQHGCGDCVRRLNDLPSHERQQWIVVTPSAYVVDALTRHWSVWQSDGWRKYDREPVANLKLLQRLYGLIRCWEGRYGVNIGLCKMPDDMSNPAKHMAVQCAREQEHRALAEHREAERVRQAKEAQRAKEARMAKEAEERSAAAQRSVEIIERRVRRKWMAAPKHLLSRNLQRQGIHGRQLERILEARQVYVDLLPWKISESPEPEEIHVGCSNEYFGRPMTAAMRRALYGNL